MNLAVYIKDLLYRYDCVIVPNFGGFLANKVSAKYNDSLQVFYPPTKQITFNAHLKHNDGLLANYIAKHKGISFEKATEKINNTVAKWQNQLQEKTINLSTIGSLSLNKEGQIIFNPSNTTNFLTESFGFSAINAKSTTKIIPLVVNKKTDSKTIAPFIKYAATAAILLTLGVSGWQGITYQKQQKELEAQQKSIEKKIQSATFVIENPLPAINLHVEKPKKYFVIAGAFHIEKNAEKKVKELQKKGFNATIVNKNKWGLTQVAFDSFNDKNKATNALYKIQNNFSKDAWLYTLDTP